MADEVIETQCVYCGEPLTLDTLTMDHVIPVSRGGTNFERNKAPACRPCNFAKAQLTADEYLRMRDQPEEMEAYKRALHDEMSQRGWERNRELHRPLPNPPPKPPPVRTTYAQRQAEERERSQRARAMAKVGECIAELGFTCYCAVCDPKSLNRFHKAQLEREHLTQTVRIVGTLGQWEKLEQEWDRENQT